MSTRKSIDVEELQKVFRLNDGNLERVDGRCKNIKKWKAVKNKKNHPAGYCQVGFKGKVLRYHNIVWVLSTNKDIPIGLEIDHLNGNKIDNRLKNLRLVDRRVNDQNKLRHRNGKLVGYYYNKPSKKYISQIRINNKLIHLGSFKTEQKAHKAYEIACKHIENYIDNNSFRKMIKKELEKE
jgi:hypothetical protein